MSFFRSNKNRCRKVLKGSGAKLRNNHTMYRYLSKKSYFCYNCGNETLKRVYSGLWSCKVCKTQVAGNAYTV